MCLCSKSLRRVLMPLFDMSKFSRGEIAVRFWWLLISCKRTHDESVIQKWLRRHACLHTYLPALWPEALARMGGHLATVKQGSGERGQRAAGPWAFQSFQRLVTTVTQICCPTKIKNTKELTEWQTNIRKRAH